MGQRNNEQVNYEIYSKADLRCPFTDRFTRTDLEWNRRRNEIIG